MNLSFNKRQKIIITSALLTIGLLSTQLVDFNLRFKFIAGLGVASYVLSLWSLWEGINLAKAVIVMILPVFYTLAVSSFYFLLPVRWLTRLPFAVVFGISVYLLMLTSNIYNVAAIRTIALLRAANAVGVLFSLISTFFLANVLFSLHLAFYWTMLGVAVIVMPLYLVGLWANELEDFISRRVFNYAAVFTYLTLQITLVFSFWPIAPIFEALAVATIMYVLLALAQLDFAGKMKPRAVWEHLGVAGIVFLVIIFATRWGG